MIKEIVARYKTVVAANNSTAEKVNHAITFYRVEAQKATERANEIHTAWKTKNYQILLDLGVLTQREYNELANSDESTSKTAGRASGRGEIEVFFEKELRRKYPKLEVHFDKEGTIEFEDWSAHDPSVGIFGGKILEINYKWETAKDGNDWLAISKWNWEDPTLSQDYGELERRIKIIWAEVAKRIEKYYMGQSRH